MNLKVACSKGRFIEYEKLKILYVFYQNFHIFFSLNTKTLASHDHN